MNPAFRMSSTMQRSVRKDFLRMRGLSLDKLCLKRLVQSPTKLLSEMSDMLISLDRVRNCFVHNGGVVDIQGVIGGRSIGDREYDAAMSHGVLWCHWIRSGCFVGNRFVPQSEITAEDMRSQDFAIETRIVHKPFRIRAPIDIDSFEMAELAYSLIAVLVRVATELRYEMRTQVFHTPVDLTPLPSVWPMPELVVTTTEDFVGDPPLVWNHPAFVGE